MTKAKLFPLPSPNSERLLIRCAVCLTNLGSASPLMPLSNSSFTFLSTLDYGVSWHYKGISIHLVKEQVHAGYYVGSRSLKWGEKQNLPLKDFTDLRFMPSKELRYRDSRTKREV